MGLLVPRRAYKPFEYPWAFEAWRTQQTIHWLPEEVTMNDDVKDWKYNLTANEKHLITQIFRFFTQSDIEVNNCYMTHYAKVFKPTEIRMMLSSFSNIETIHIAAYSYLLDTLGLPEVEYQAFMKYKEMCDKVDYMDKFGTDTKEDTAITLAAFGGFTEGLQLFASFAILLNFPRFNKLKGMGQIVTWSVRDESLHIECITKLFRTFVQENPEIWTEKLKGSIYEVCATMVHLEDAFIELAFELGDINGLTVKDMKRYIRYIADRRLQQLGLKEVYMVEENPLPWLDEILNGVEHANFFENRVTEYTKSGTTGDWSDAFSEMDESPKQQQILPGG